MIASGKYKYNWGDRLFSFLYAIIVIVQPLTTFLPVTWSMTIILLSVPYLLIRGIKQRKSFKSVFFVSLYAAFRIINYGTTIEELLTMFILVLFAISLSNNEFYFENFFKWTTRIAIIASACIGFQVLVHTTIGVHIPFLTTGMIRGAVMASGYENLITTGMSLGVYRPSAFFLEPSTFASYSFPVIFYLLFKCKDTIGVKYALWISLGMVVSTSSMGTLLAVFMWGIYLFNASFKENKIKTKWFLVFCTVIVIGVIAFLSSPKIQYSILRIYQGMGDNQYSAVRGRLGGGQYYISQLSKSEYLFGTGKSTENLTMYLSGIYHLIYTDGIICAVIFELMFVSRFFMKKGFDRIFMLVVVAVSVFSDVSLIHSLMYLLIYVFTEIDEVRLKRSRVRLRLRRNRL